MLRLTSWARASDRKAMATRRGKTRFMVLILYRQGRSTSCSTLACRERWENGASFTQVRLAIFHTSSDSAMRGISEVAVVQHIDRRFWRRHRTSPAVMLVSSAYG